ncbi:hypothetical protein GY45DRAFT_365964 [Cubamyces sp. BRFM 1775]|nr:hypothetical protein GY45DRAFT_365964 [Cubamyces sp. BRFM 1775]
MSSHNTQELQSNGPAASSGPFQETKQVLDTAIKPPEPSHAGQAEERVVETVSGLSQAVTGDGVTATLLDGVNSLVEALPPLLRLLDEVANIHPVVKIAVGAFNIIVELEVKRRDNDRKAKLLFSEMRKMMESLVHPTRLKDVDSKDVGTDGMAIGQRLDGVMKKIAIDIKECAAACNAYWQKTKIPYCWALPLNFPVE